MCSKGRGKSVVGISVMLSKQNEEGEKENRKVKGSEIVSLFSISFFVCFCLVRSFLLAFFYDASFLLSAGFVGVFVCELPMRIYSPVYSLVARGS